MAQALPVVVNFVAFYYKRFVTDASTLAAAYGPRATLSPYRPSVGKGETLRTPKEISDYLKTQLKGENRVVITNVEQTTVNDDTKTEFYVHGALYSISTGALLHGFVHLFDLRRVAGEPKSYYISSHTMQIEDAPITVAPPPPPPAAVAESSLWSAETPPMFAKDAPADPIPAFEVGPAVTAQPAKVEEPKAETAAPAAAKPAKEEKPSAKSGADKARPPKQSPPVAAPAPEAAAAPAPAAAPAAPAKEEVPAAPTKEAADDKTAQPKTFADLVKKPTEKGDAPAPKADAKPVRPPAQTPPAPEAAPEKPAPKPTTPPTPPPQPAAPAEEAVDVAPTAVAEPKPAIGQKVVWGAKPLTFAAAAAGSGDHKPAVVVAPDASKPAKTVPAVPKTAPPAAAAAPAPVAAAAAAAAAAPVARGQAVPAINYHIFIKGLPEGTTEDEICDMLKAFMTLKRPLKIEQKNVKEDTKDGPVDKVRTFGFALIEGSQADVERCRKTVVGKQFKIRGQNVYVDEVREKAAYLPKK